MERLQNVIKLALPICIVLGVVGYSFEFFYLLAFDIIAHEKLRIPHFVASGAILTLPTFLFLLLVAQFKKFFTKSIHEDDFKKITQALASTNFKQQVTYARASLAVSFIYAITTVLTAKLGYRFPAGGFMIFLVLFNLENFLAAIILSPIHARFTVLLMFVVSVLLCFTAGGYGMGIYDRVKDGAIRDDLILKLEKSGNVSQILPKDLPFEVPFLSKFLNKL